MGIPGIDVRPDTNFSIKSLFVQGGELIRAYVVKSDNTLTEKDVEATVAGSNFLSL